MSKEDLSLAEEITGWKANKIKQYEPDFLDRIMMQRTEEACHYGKRNWRNKLDYD
ncbi:hypothetical protein D3C85_1547380 [compost metagenome]